MFYKTNVDSEMVHERLFLVIVFIYMANLTLIIISQAMNFIEFLLNSEAWLCINYLYPLILNFLLQVTTDHVYQSSINCQKFVYYACPC